MNFSVARTLLERRGYDLIMRDGTWRNRPMCRVYAVADGQEYRICHFTAFATAGVPLFKSWIAELPPVTSAEVAP